MDKLFFDPLDKGGYIRSDKKFKFYLETYLFRGIDLKGKRIIDIGGGNGVYGFYASLMGAKEVIVMEPEFDGSTSGVIKQFHEIQEMFPDIKNVKHTNKVLEEYDYETEKFDIIMMLDSINHIDEDACIVLAKEDSARKKYLDFFELLGKISSKDCQLIVTDCSSKNFFADVGLKNFMVPTIEWHKHQPPELWVDLLNLVGYKHQNTSWASFSSLGLVGRMIMANKFVSYFANSHFRITLKYIR